MKLTAWEHFPYPVRKAWRVMRITTLLILVISLHLSAKTTAQKITLSSNDISIEQFFKQLKKQTGYSFLLENGVVSKDEKISVNVKDVSLEIVLDQILKPINLSYKIENKTVYILKSSQTPLTDETNLPPIDIHGRVTDSLGNPLVGVSVVVKGAKTGTSTDANGNFTLYRVSENATLIISNVGYEQQMLKVKGENSIVISLKRHSTLLQDVVINKGYYTEKKALSTGDVSVVTAKEIDLQPITNVLQGLEGRVPGLLITQQNGQPGGAFTVQIRGQNSLVQGNNPFYVVDGVPYDATLPAGLLNGSLEPVSPNGHPSYSSPLNFINPYDIESVEILKDADATAIYGSRAANGAILITTKKGKPGAMRVEAQLNAGFSSPARDIQMMNTQQYLMMRNEAFKNDGTTPNPNSNFDLTFWDTTRYTNWSKVLTNAPAPYLNARASISGGTANTQYLIGMNYYRQATPFPTLLAGDGADEKPSFHFNINSQSDNQKFKVSFNGSYVSDKNTVQTVDLSANRLLLSPDAPPLFNPDGSLNWAPITPGQVGTWTNPYSNLYIGYNNITSSLVGNTIFSYHFLSNLELKTSLGYTNIQTDEVKTVPTTFFDPGYNVSSGFSYFNEMNSHSFIVEPQLDYNLHLGQGLLSTLIGGTFQQNQMSQKEIQAVNFPSDAVLANYGAAGQIFPNGTNYSQYKYEAVFARLNYTLQDRYILNLTARRDGSSRFGPGNQFGNFGAAGVGWIFSREKFVENNFSFLSFGKIRASYGTTGNDQVGNYSYLELYNITGYPYNSAQGFYPAGPLNPNLAWEVDRKLEVGIELGFLKDRINVEASFYRNRSSNQLVNTPLPSITGFYSVQSNLPALVQNTGLEFQLNTVNIKSSGFNWTSSFNLAMNRNKLLAFPNLANSTYSQTYVIGQPLSIIKAFNMIGVNPTTGVYQFADAKGQPTYNPSFQTDKTELINTTPQFYGGFANTFSYKGFSLDFLFQFVNQTGINLFGTYQTMPGTEFNQPVDYLNRWQKPGDKAKYQMFSQNYGGQASNELNYAPYSNFAYSDASYIRLKNLSLSYSLPSNWDKIAHLKSCQVFVQAQNLLTITKYEGIDPESQGSSLPPMRVVTFGFMIKF